MNILGLIDLPDTLVLLGIILTIYYLYLTKDHGVFKAMGVPATKPLPFFGSWAIYKMPMNERYTKLREKYGKVYGLFKRECPTLVVGDLELVRQVMVKEFPTFTDRMPSPFLLASVPPMSLILFDLEGDYWKTIRRIITPTFTSGKLKQMVSAINATSKTLVSCLKERADKNDDIIARDYTGPFTMDTIASVAFGVDVDCQRNPEDKFVKHVHDIMKDDMNMMSPIPWILFIFPFMAPLVKRLTLFMGWKNPYGTDASIKFFENTVNETLLVRQAMNKKHTDYLQLLVEAKILSGGRDGADNTTHQTDGVEERNPSPPSEKSHRKLTRDEVVAQCVMFYLAGHETTATSLIYSFYELAFHQEIQDKLVAEIYRHHGQDADPDYESVAKCEYLEMFLMEVLRIYPPLVAVSRKASGDARLGHYLIPKGTEIWIPIWQIHHDPDIWENPERFQPERFHPDKRAQHHSAQWLAFGLGPRLCVGMRLAMVELKIALIYVLRRYRITKSEQTQVPLTYDTNDFFNKPASPIHVCISNREK